MMINTNYRSSNEYQKAIQFWEKGCKCNCSKKVPCEEFARLRVQFQNLPKSAQDAFVMGQLLNTSGGKTALSKRLRDKERVNQRNFYRWDHNTFVCEWFYLHMLGKSRAYLDTIVHELFHIGLITRTHGNTGRPPQWKTKMNLNQKAKETIKNFILNYAETHGLPDPGKSKNKKYSIILLPTEMSYKSVHQDFLASLEEDNNLKSLKYEAFRRLWHQLTPHIKFMSPRSDLCDTCHQLHNELHSCQDEVTKAQLKKKIESTKNKPN
jgi:hypothetical protein